MRVLWTAAARQRREAIFDHIAADNPRAALWLDERFADATKRLAAFPNIGRQGRVADTRELIVHENYSLVYEVAKDKVVILAIHHAARRHPLS